MGTLYGVLGYRWAIQARPTTASPPRTPTTHNLAHPVRRVAAAVCTLGRVPSLVCTLHAYYVH